MPLHKLTAPKVIETLKPIAESGKLDMVRRLCQRTNGIMVWAVNTGLIETNPLAGMRDAFPTPTKRNLPTIQSTQLPQLTQLLSCASITLTTRCLIEWQLHTMTRPGEAAGARWDEINADNSVWHTPAERMKKARSHAIPLSPQALMVLELMRPQSGELEFISPSGRDLKSHTNESTANVALKRMGYGGLLVAHGLRALASTTLNEQGFDPDVIEAALSHADKNEVRLAYNRAEYLQRRRVMMVWWSELIEKAAAGNMDMASGSGNLRVI